MIDVAPTDGVRLPFRWQFLPIEGPRDGMITWRWRAYTQTGSLALESAAAFDSLTECMDNARLSGYQGH